MWGDDPESSAATCSGCRKTADEWAEEEAAGRPNRFHVEKGWCWRAANVGAADPTRCISPRPTVTAEGEEILDLIALCSSQVRVSFSGLIGFDWNVVERRARERGVDIDSSWWGLAGWWEVFRLAESAWVAAVKARKSDEDEAEGEAE